MAGKNSDRLSGVQVTALVALIIVGSGLMKLPRDVVQASDANGIMVTLIAGLMAVVLTMVMSMLSKRFPNRTVLDYSKDLLGTIPAKIVNIVFVVYFITFSGLILRIFADAAKVFLLENTPIEVLILAMLPVVVYLVQNGINPIARICEAFFPVVVGSILLLLLLSLQNFDIKEVYPVWQVNIVKVVKAVPVTEIAYFGFEILLFAGAFMLEPQKMTKYGVGGVVTAIVIYVATVTACIGVFSIDTLKYQVYPTLELAKSIDFPGAFAERFDIFFAIFWTIAVFTSIVTYYYLAAFSVTKLIGMRNYRPFCYLLLPGIYVIALLPQNVYQVRLLAQWIIYLGTAAAAVIPGLLFAAAIIRGKGGKNIEKA